MPRLTVVVAQKTFRDMAFRPHGDKASLESPMRNVIAAAVSLLLLWHLRTLAAVNAGNVFLLHAVMAKARPRLAVSYAALPRVEGVGVRRAARAFVLAGHDSTALRGLAQTMLWSGQYRNAAVVIDEALEHGGDVRDRMLAGEAHFRAGDRPRAIAEWTAASKDAGVLLPLGAQLLQQVPDDGSAEAFLRVSDVVAVLRTALAQRGLTDQGRSLLLTTLSKAYATIHDLRSAEEAVRPIALGAQPDPDALAMLASLALENHRGQDAERFARAAIAHDAQRTRWVPHYILGLTALDRCDLDVAARQFRDGLSAPYDGDYRYYSQRWFLGVVEYERGDGSAALADWSEYLKAQPNDADRRERIAKAVADELPRRCKAEARPS